MISGKAKANTHTATQPTRVTLVQAAGEAR